MLIALRWFAKGGMLSEPAAFHGVSKSTVSRVILKVAEYLSTTAPEKIKFPENRYVYNY
jgi:hypothetical protein